ncbi:uncharacterized protein LOC129757810 [Uranotaenia lowii]|uniref:uncharacterized protein LOC129757810 n=1 Tax=Uranotaenia lowii TaxID=190385 RepID=UPI00247B0A62|nr:uncharacterized protein LOC129757810 [Uranotaenia lowii]
MASGSVTSSKPKKEPENFEYNNNDTGPYRVFVELKEQGASNVNINKFSLGAHLKKIEDIKGNVQELQQLGKNKIIVKLNNYDKANKLVNLINTDNSIYRAYVPKHAVSISGVIADIPLEITEEEILNDIESEAPVICVKRLFRYDENNEKIFSQRVSVTFRACVLPRNVRLFCCVTRVQPFLQRSNFCQNCLRFGHKTENCKGRKRCHKCGIIHNSDKEYEECKSQIKCVFCKTTEHVSGAINCRETIRQKNIKNTMAYQNLTYAEAQKLTPITTMNRFESLNQTSSFPAINETFAKVVSKSNELKQQWSKTNEMRPKLFPTVPSKQNNEPIKSAPKRIRNEEPTGVYYDNINLSHNNGTGLNNPHKTSDTNTYIMRKVAETKKEFQLMMMNFYTELVGQENTDPESVQRFKQLAKKHLKLDTTFM